MSFKVRFRVNGADSSTTFIGLPEDEASTKDAASTFAKMVHAVGPAEALEWQRRNDDPEPEAGAGLTLDEWAELYIDGRTGVTDGTRYGYRRTYALTYGARLGKLPIGAITRADVAAALNYLTTKGGRKGKGYKDKTIANAHGLLASMMKEAVHERHVTINPCARIRLPRATSHESQGMNLVSKVEFMRLVEKTPEHYRPLVMTLFGTGIRWGEAEALEVRDFDPRARTLRINKAAKWDTSKATRTVGPTKTKHSDRTITLPSYVVAALLPLTSGRPRGARLFVAPRGGALRHKTFWQDAWVPACEKAELVDPRPRIHDARHSHASWLIAENPNLVRVQRRLGHHSIKVTVDTYGHLTPDGASADAAAVEMAIEGFGLPELTA